jgi:cobalamin biosynthesis Mg chelatase CobN
VGLPFLAVALIQMMREYQAEAVVIDAQLDAREAARAQRATQQASAAEVAERMARQSAAADAAQPAAPASDVKPAAAAHAAPASDVKPAATTVTAATAGVEGAAGDEDLGWQTDPGSPTASRTRSVGGRVLLCRTLAGLRAQVPVTKRDNPDT